MKSIKSLFALVATVALLWTSTSIALAQGAGSDQPTPIARGPHISGVVQVMAHRPPAAGAAATSSAVGCTVLGGGNVKTDCASTGRPVNETWVATNGSLLVAGANDYNSYNGQGQDGFYWSTDGATWNDAGPLDVFPHNNNNGAGDPGLAVDASGVVYYSSLFFNFYRCNVGGVELLRRDPATGSWSSYQIAADSSAQFQDKPAIALDETTGHVYVSWTQFGSCSGSGVTSPIKVAVLPTGSSSVSPSQILPVPGSTYSQGSSIQPDGQGGFWIAWEEYPSASATTGSIQLAHWTGTGWAVLSGANAWETISPLSFTDLPSPLPGFAFRDNSFPALAVANGNPEVAWTAYNSGSGPGRAYLWSSGSATMLSNSGGDQFFPAIAPDGSGGVFVSYSQVNAGQGTYDQWLWHGASPTKVSTAPSNPSQDAFFSGQFIGDYNGMTLLSGQAQPIWTDIRSADPTYPGWEMDSMTVPGTTGGTTSTVPSAPTLQASAGDSQVTLTWSVPFDGGSPITGYNIYRATTSGGEGTTPYVTVDSSTTTYTDTGLTNGVPYYYEVTAVNTNGESAPSSEVSATPAAVTAPSAPQNLQARTARGHNARGVQLNWSAPASDGGAAITGYNVYRENGSTCDGNESQLTVLGNVTSYSDTATTSGASYCYDVTAVNAASLESLPSNQASAIAK